MPRSDKLTPPSPEDFVSALRERLSYDPSTGDFHFRHTGKRAGCLDKSTGYIRIRLWDKLYHAHRLAWAYVTGSFPDAEVDHRDLDRANNSWMNLRKATHSQNAQNKNAPVTNRSGHKGVSFDASRGKWRATIRVNGVWQQIGRFDDREEAKAAYLKVANDLQKEFLPQSLRHSLAR